MQKKPNIILMICHDLGKHLNCYGQETVESPVLDKLASEGVRFQNSFCTAPVCSPSRGALITGRYPASNGVVGLSHNGFQEKFNNDEMPLPVILKEQGGYDTYIFGGQHATSDMNQLKYTQTFPEGLQCGAGRDCRTIAADFENFIKNRGSEKPFYAHIEFYETHRPFDFGGTQPYTEKGVKVPAFLADIPIAREDFAKLQGLIKKVDTSIGKILGLIEEHCSPENTWVIFTVDHGIPFPLAKTTLYDPGIDTALIMQYKGENISGGRVYDELISNVDILPTILEGVGIEVPARVQGKSFWKLLKSEKYEKRTEVFAQGNYQGIYDPIRAIRTDEHKLIVNFEYLTYAVMLKPNENELEMGRKTHERYVKNKEFLEFYDLRVDPTERNNIASFSEHEAIRNELLGRLYSWMKESNDPLLDGPVPSATYRNRIAKLKEIVGE